MCNESPPIPAPEWNPWLEREIGRTPAIQWILSSGAVTTDAEG